MGAPETTTPSPPTGPPTTPPAGGAPAAEAPRRQRLSWWQWVRKHPGASLGCALSFGFLLVVAAPGWFAQIDPNQIDVDAALAPPSGAHWFGTDDTGRDIFSRVAYGTRVTLGIVLASILLSAASGGIAGMISGFYGKSLDMALGRAVDVVLSFPPFILGVMVTGILGPNTRNLVLALTVIYFPTFFRIGRSGVMTEATKVYAEAAYSLGYPKFWILGRHLSRNVLPTLFAQFMVVFPLALQIQAALSFLGLGVQPPTPDWGNVLEQGKNFLLVAPWMSFFPGMAILLAALAAILLGRAAQRMVDDR